MSFLECSILVLMTKRVKEGITTFQDVMEKVKDKFVMHRGQIYRLVTNEQIALCIKRGSWIIGVSLYSTIKKYFLSLQKFQEDHVLSLFSLKVTISSTPNTRPEFFECSVKWRIGWKHWYNIIYTTKTYEILRTILKKMLKLY